jgi:serine protease Do
MQGIDLELFQFDYDLTFAVLFLNADRTIYGRFGTRFGVRSQQMTHISLAALGKSMARALDLHRAYPGNKTQLQGHTGPVPNLRVPEDWPNLKKRVAAGPATRKNCLHCHDAGDALLKQKVQNRTVTARDVFPYPVPDQVGLKMEIDDGLRIKQIKPGSLAEKAGLKPGATLVRMSGQALTSQADIQWVLHHAPQEAKIPVTYRLDGAERSATLELTGTWRESKNSWRSSLWGLRPGLELEILPESARKPLDLPPGKMALRVRYSFREAAKAGVRVNDIVIAVNGRDDLLTEGLFLTHLRAGDNPPAEARLTLLRGKQSIEATVPLR